jgi:16S rRNA (cytosine967-C5)-methyltransferase
VLRHYGNLTARLGTDTPLLVAMLATHLLEGEALEDVLALADGSQYAPPPLSDADAKSLAHAAQTQAKDKAAQLAVPDWLLADIEAQLAGDTDAVLQAMTQRAPLDVRVNALKATPQQAMDALAEDGLQARPHTHIETALRFDGAPRLADTKAFKKGLIEVQDGGAQAVASMCAAKPFETVVDFCAGGGGKALALAADMNNKGRLLVHDAIEMRMKGLDERARRAGVDIIETLAPSQIADMAAQCDLVVADVPCSGVGRWRRAPETKWRLTRDELDALCALQADILRQAATLVKPGGRLAYMTCSILASENSHQVARFIEENQSFKLMASASCFGQSGQAQLHPSNADTDGLYCAVLEKHGA